MSASPSPSASSSTKSSSKRTRASSAVDDYEESVEDKPVSRKRKANTSAAVAVTGNKKKEERMERNRQAAQASRDRRKAYTEELEAKVALLQAELASAKTTSPVLVPSTSVDLDRMAELEAENASLREQLALSKSEGAQVQSRLESFEGKLEWLTQLMFNNQQQQLPSQPPVLPSAVSTLSVSPSDLQLPSPPGSNHTFESQTLFPPSAPVALDSTTLLASNMTPMNASLDQVDSHVAANFDLFQPDAFNGSSLFGEQTSLDFNNNDNDATAQDQQQLAQLAKEFTFFQPNAFDLSTSQIEVDSRGSNEFFDPFWVDEISIGTQQDDFGQAFSF